jgi:carnitine-CoA ligase
MRDLRIDLASLLEQRAAELADRPFLALSGGVRLTFGEFNAEVNRVAHGFATLVRAGDRVACMLPNSLEFLLVSYALKKLGAVEVAVNTNFRGPGLARMLNASESAVLVAGGELLGHVVAVEPQLRHLRTIVVAGEAALQPAAELVALAALTTGQEGNPPRPAVADTELMSVLFTSGTTGQAKGCMLSHRYAVRLATGLIGALGLESSDCLYCPFPLYHVDAAYLTVVPALVLGARAGIGTAFSVSRFWDEVDDFGATVFDFMGSTLTLLWKQEERAGDADNPVRLAWGVPMPAFREGFERRFGLRLLHCYGLTDGGMVAYESPRRAEPHGSCGRPHDPYDVRIAGEDGAPLAAGAVGEILLRSREPGVMMQGYYGLPAESREVLRDGWLHTGDFGSLDARGYLYFAGRKKDAIRRRGENISAWEIEDVVNSHPAVAESVAIGVPSELTEEDVKVFVVLRSGAGLAADELRAFCAGRMARFMIPEFVEFVDEIPKTPTGKPEKYRLMGERAARDREGGSHLRSL